MCLHHQETTGILGLFVLQKAMCLPEGSAGELTPARVNSSGGLGVFQTAPQREFELSELLHCIRRQVPPRAPQDLKDARSLGRQVRCITLIETGCQQLLA